MPRLAVLLVGFNRPLLIEKRLEVILSDLRDSDTFTLFVSLDGPRESNNRDNHSLQHIENIVLQFQNVKHINVLRNNRNLGPDEHIPRAITEVLHIHDAVIVIEDDIEISSRNLDMMIKKVRRELESRTPIFLVLSMSGIRMLKFIPVNFWRKSAYFSPWGYAVSRGFWDLHTNGNLQDADEHKKSKAKMNSEIWSKMSSRRKQIWNERFSRKTYDYKIQETMFRYGVKSYAPFFRMSDNEGFMDKDATHTRFKEPKFMRRKTITTKRISNNLIFETSSFFKFCRVIDSQTWAGDGLLSARGRSIGLRTIFIRWAKLNSKILQLWK